MDIETVAEETPAFVAMSGIVARAMLCLTESICSDMVAHQGKIVFVCGIKPRQLRSVGVSGAKSRIDCFW